ncbi:uncharacterized protein [Dermacentor albipictus]|uniref:uncharacterized protein n=1 Tax=Dermacentor albipictus TaxID=60249 RepID=UPI0038FD36C9
MYIFHLCCVGVVFDRPWKLEALVHKSSIEGTEVSLRPDMRFLSLTCVVVLLAVGVALSFGAVEESQEAHLRVRRGTGCPDIHACIRSCQSEGKRGGGPTMCICDVLAGCSRQDWSRAEARPHWHLPGVPQGWSDQVVELVVRTYTRVSEAARAREKEVAFAYHLLFSHVFVSRE